MIGRTGQWIVAALLGITVLGAPSIARAGETEIVSLVPSGAGWTYSPDNSEFSDVALSADGRFVVFRVTNHVYGAARGLLLRDRIGFNTIVLAENSYHPAISADGRYVTYDDGVNVLTLYDRTTGVAERVNFGLGSPGGRASISTDARSVAFSAATSPATGHYCIYVRDRVWNTITLASASFDGLPAEGQSWGASISGDGRFVAFTSNAWDIDEDDWNDYADVFVRDMSAGKTKRVSIGTNGSEPNGPSDNARISGDGRRVVFTSTASNLVTGDTNGQQDVFVHDLASGVTRRMSALASGSEPPAGSQGEARQPSISADGSLVVFSTVANLIPQDTRLTGWDVYVRNVDTGEMRLANVSALGVQDSSGASSPEISADGRVVAFKSGDWTIASNATRFNHAPILTHDLFDTPTHTSFSTKSTTPGYGAKTTLNARIRLRSQWGPLIGGPTVRLQRLSKGSWVDVASSAVASAPAAFDVTVTSATSYRLQSSGVSGVYSPSASDVITLKPKTAVGWPRTVGRVHPKKRFSLYGSLKPRHRAGSAPVRIYKYKRVKDKWKGYGYVKAKVSNYKGYSRYKAKLSLPSKGRWLLRAYAPADAEHAAQWSDSRATITVY